MKKAILGMILGLIVLLAATAQAQSQATGLISLKLCWLAGSIGPEGTPPERCSRLGANIRVEIHGAKEAGRYKQSGKSPWLTNYSLGKFLFATRSDERGRLLLELPPGDYFIRPLGENYHSPGDEFLQVKPGDRLKVSIWVIGNI